MERTITFTRQELDILSDAVLQVMQNAYNAQKEIPDSAVHKAINKYAEKLREINSKICGEMEEE